MADITGNTGQIALVSLGDTINDWRNLTNDQIIAKLNLLKVYGISAGVGLDAVGGVAGGGTGGTFEMQVSDTIAKGITIDGNLNVTGNVSFSTAGEVSFPNGLVNVNGDDTPVAGAATAGMVVGSYTGPNFNSGTTHPFFLNLGGSWFTNQDLKLIGGGTLTDASIQKILFGQTNGKTLSFSQTSTSLVIGNGHTQDIIPVGSTLAGQIARIRSIDGRVDILNGVNKRRVSGISHGFSFGKVVRASSVDTTGFTLAIASGGSTYAEAVGIISRVNGDSDFEVTFNGEVEGAFNLVNDTASTLSTGCPYFISPSTTGNITPVEPSTDGHISKPVMIGLSGDRGLFVNYRGQEVNTNAIGGGGGAGATGDPSSVRRTIAASGFTIGQIVSQTEEGVYELLSPENKSRMIGIVVRQVSGGHELLLYGMSNDNDAFRVNNNTLWNGDDTLLYPIAEGVGIGFLTDLVPADGSFSPVALKMGNHILFFNSRFGQGYSTPSSDAFNNTSRSTAAYTAAIVAGGGSGDTVGGGGYVQTTTGANTTNILVNGGFDIWQRGANTTAMTSGTDDIYFADRWIRTSTLGGGAGSSAGMSIHRRTFSGGQSEVLGNPKYYIESTIEVTGGAGETYGDNVRLSNVLENANSYANMPLAFSFYAKGTSGVTGFLAVEYAQHWGSTASGNVATQKLDLVYLDGTDDWVRYVIGFKPLSNVIGSPTKDSTSFSRLSIIPYRYNGETGSIGSADVGYTAEFGIAQCKLETGFKVTNPVKVDIQEEYRRAKRFYQTSYDIDNSIGTNTLLLNSGGTDESSPTFFMGIQGNVRYKLPVEMRAKPETITNYSPSGTVRTAFNVNAGVDLPIANGSKGYNNQTRESVSGTRVTSSSNSPSGINIFIPDGFVPLDTVTVHYAADAEFNTGVTE